jgi:hypothetical protein
MGGDERGPDARPPVHAVRARDVLQSDGLRALPGALRSCNVIGRWVPAYSCTDLYILNGYGDCQSSVVIRTGNAPNAE